MKNIQIKDFKTYQKDGLPEEDCQRLREDGTDGCSIGVSNVDSAPCLAGSGQHHLKLTEILELFLSMPSKYIQEIIQDHRN